MNTATLYNTVSGELSAVIGYFDVEELSVHLSDTISFIEGSWDRKTHIVDLETGESTPRAPRLEEVRDIALSRSKYLRDAKSLGGCLTPFGPVDTDDRSQIKLSGAVQMAAILGDTFSIDWRFADNSIATLDKDQMIQVGMAVGQHVNLCQQRKNELDAAIAACATIEEVEAIDLESGWP